MATLLLSAAGAAIGGAVGGSVLGVSSAAIGRLVGATIGRTIDQSLMGAGSQAVETGRIDRFRLNSAGEGAPIGQLYGRMRLSGQVIWATEFLETATTTTTGGGKGGPSQPRVTTTSYSYSVSLAVALCEGQISHVGRVWADGEEIALDTLNMRVYPGSMTQIADPKIAATEGLERTPAFRGTAYVVLEDLELERFGNRVPQLSFEVSRPAQDGDLADPQDMASGIEAVALMPGTGEYALATTPVTYDSGFGRVASANVNTNSAQTDFSVSLEALGEQLPACSSTSLIVSWFGTDLRCGECKLEPRVERTAADGASMPWRVAGIDRAAATVVPTDGDERPIYGGTPTDTSVVEAISALKAAGQAVMFYPFILMTQEAGNTLTDPYSGAPGQPELPWRGRITTSLAPGVPGTPDLSAAAEAEVATFMGVAQPSDFAVNGTDVAYTGPADTGYRRFILHYAHLCAAAGGVESFCIGSEMRGLTRIRGAGQSFPTVAAFVQLAAECRAILGPDCKISYASDWSEYFGYQLPEGGGDMIFHLDPLWADPNIDFIGIDNYMPLSDWRDGTDHLDADAGSIYNLDYLKANVAGGEGYDYFYHSVQARAAQIRTPITDGAHGEPWVYRYKDIRNWWENDHHDRVGGVRAAVPTAWVPGSKPVWFTEMGCAAVDKGTNEPNKFLDPKSSESSLPVHSNGLRDPLIQLQYLRAMYGYWRDGANNPVSASYGGPMVDMARAHVWAWDARPYPFFPANSDVWADSDNYARGHWITGRATGRNLGDVVTEICARSGVVDVDVSRLHGFVRGYLVPDVSNARAALQPLMLAYGFDAVERDGVLVFFNRDGRATRALSASELVVGPGDTPTLELERAASAELAGRVQVTYLDADAEFETAAADAVFQDGDASVLTQSELNLAMTRSEARVVAERWLAETQLARDVAKFTLPPSQGQLGAGDVVSLPEEGGDALYRIDHVEQAEALTVEAVRVEPGVYERPADIEAPVTTGIVQPTLPVFSTFLDLPLLTGDELPHAPHLALGAQVWPGAAAVYSSASGANYGLLDVFEVPATFGEVLEEVPASVAAVVDRTARIKVRLTGGTLSHATEEALLSGANLAALGDGTPDGWELFQFLTAELVDTNTYELSGLLRAQAGTQQQPVTDAGATFVLIDGAVRQLPLASSTRGVAQSYLIGPASRSFDDPSYHSVTEAFAGNGLRPYAPVHLRAQEAGGDTTLTWIRRTRIDGDLWDVPEVPLGEASELYRVRVTQGLTVLREAEVSSPAWSYTAAEKASDGLVGGYVVRVAQVSEKFGAGFEAAVGVG